MSEWIVQARQGFAVGGETIELRDEANALINLDNLSFTMRITGWERDEVFTIASGNFTRVPPVAPATYSTKVVFSMTVPQVAALRNGANRFEVLIADQDNVLIGELSGRIEKKNA